MSLAQADDDQDGAEDERGSRERDDQTLDGPLERGSRLRAAFGRPDNLSVDALAARVRDKQRCPAGQQPRASKYPLFVPDARVIVGMRRCGHRALPDWIRLAGQGGLIDLQVGTCQHDAVGWKRLAGHHNGEVAGHDVPRSHFDRHAVAHDGSPARKPTLQALSRCLGPPVEEDVHEDERHNRAEQRGRFRHLAHDAVQRAGSGEEPDHRIPRRITSQRPPRMLDGFDDVVRTVSLTGLERSTGGEAPGARPVWAEPIRWNVRNDHDS